MIAVMKQMVPQNTPSGIAQSADGGFAVAVVKVTMAMGAAMNSTRTTAIRRLSKTVPLARGQCVSKFAGEPRTAAAVSVRSAWKG